MELLTYKEYDEYITNNGIMPGWIARQIPCSSSLLYQYRKGLQSMKKDKVEKLHKILFGE